jgi:dolichol-phosphate mannosyltransferase
LSLIGVTIPSYNEAESIPSLLISIRECLPDSIIAVIDDSPNLETVKVIQKLNLPNVEVQHRETKGGRGSAILVGIDLLLKKGCDKIIEMDADFSHHPQELSAIIKRSNESQIDLLIASRYLPESQIVNWPLSRRIFSKSSNLLARTLLQVPIHDYTNGYRCYSRLGAEHIVKTCGKYGKGFIALSEILVNLYYSKYKVDEIPTKFVNRVRGESSVNIVEIKNALTGLFKIYGLKRKLIAERP